MCNSDRYYKRCNKETLKVSRACGERQAGGNHGASTGKEHVLYEDVELLMGSDGQEH